jgi:hypothetical protein
VEVEWDQARVAALAGNLVEPLEALRADLESRPSVPGKEKVERLHTRSTELARQLASGAGRAETVALFREVETLQSQAAKHSREYPAPFDMHVYIDRLDTTTKQLARYYNQSSGVRQ